MTPDNATATPPTPVAPPTASEDEQFLIELLREQEMACPLCQYNLRGISRAQCPECGRGLTLRVVLAEPYLRAWVTAMVSLCVAAGPGLFFAAGFVTGLLRQGIRALDNVPTVAWVGLGLVWLCIPCAVACLASRRRFLRLPHAAQRDFAIASVFLAVLALGTLLGAILLNP